VTARLLLASLEVVPANPEREAAGEGAARALLTAMLPRLTEPPHRLLGVGDGAAPEVVRAAFLRLTRQFHPQRFARFGADVVRLANEIFLTIKEAHDRLRRGETGALPVRGATPPPAAPVPRQTPATGTPVLSRELATALALLERQRWGEARAAFHQLAVAAPHEPRHRAHMHYARGREALAVGRADEARAELRRALALAPDLAPARRVLAGI
jgi:tetratricopeptide (TPR) repeat protein